jgi:hypothetical protein
VPPLVVRSDLWFFEKKSGRMIIQKPPTNTPYYSLLVYNINDRYCNILYNTTFHYRYNFYYDANYKNFITFFENPKLRRIRRVFLYDIIEGAFSGKIIIPAKEVCYKVGIDFSLAIGFLEEVIISCKSQGRFSLTIYDTAESNENGSFHLLLKNGVTVPLRKISGVICGGIYDLDTINGHLYIIVCPRERRYKPVKYLVDTTQLENAQRVTIKFDPWSRHLFILGLLGPHIIRVTQLCNPRVGLLKKGTGNWILQQTRTHIIPHSKDSDPKRFHISPFDGSLLHFIRSALITADKTEHFTFVEIYKRVIITL